MLLLYIVFHYFYTCVEISVRIERAQTIV